MKKSAKESCWQCFKLYLLDIETSKYKTGQKGFCSKACFEAFEKANSMTCSLNGCLQAF